MNGTLISYPPGGGGSGSSVTNGGPAWVEAVASKKPIAIPANQSFIWRLFRSDKINRDSEPVQRGIIDVSASGCGLHRDRLGASRSDVRRGQHRDLQHGRHKLRRETLAHYLTLIPANRRGLSIQQ